MPGENANVFSETIIYIFIHVLYIVYYLVEVRSRFSIINKDIFQ